MNFKKLVRTGALVTAILGASITFVSKDTEIKAGVDNLKNIAKNYKNSKAELAAQLEEKTNQLNTVLAALGLQEGATTEEIQNAINNLSQEDLSSITEALGLDSTATKQEIVNEIASINTEIAQLEADSETAQNKIDQLLAEIEKANTEEEGQLAYINTAIEEVGATEGDLRPTESIELQIAKEIYATNNSSNFVQNVNGKDTLHISYSNSIITDNNYEIFVNGITGQYATINKNGCTITIVPNEGISVTEINNNLDRLKDGSIQ